MACATRSRVAVFYSPSPVYGERSPGASPLDHRRPRSESASSAAIGAGPRYESTRRVDPCPPRITAVGSRVPYGLGACSPSSARSTTTAREVEITGRRRRRGRQWALVPHVSRRSLFIGVTLAFLEK